MLMASVRSRVEIRLMTNGVRLLSTRPPLILLPGANPSQEQNAFSLRHLLMSTPISETMKQHTHHIKPDDLSQIHPADTL